MGEDSLKPSGLLSGLAVLLSSDEHVGSTLKQHLVTYHDDSEPQLLERTLEHIFDLHDKSFVTPSCKINIENIYCALREQAVRLDPGVVDNRDGILIVDHGLGAKNVVVDSTSICGDIKFSARPLLVESLAAFSSARFNACVWKGKWMYEVTLETSGVQQLGWATLSCAFTDQAGVGDSEDSYAFDGRRVMKWNKEAKSYGQSWTVGDVIGCCIDLDVGVIIFYRNGVCLGVAYAGIRKVAGQSYYPAISLSDGERCHLNFGSHPFKYPICGFDPIQAPPRFSSYADYLLRSLSRLLEVQGPDKSESTSFRKMLRLMRLAHLRELIQPISKAICAEFFRIIEECHECAEYVAGGSLTSFLMDVFKPREPHDFQNLDQVIDLFLLFPGSPSLFECVIMALSCDCKTAPVVLTECPYTGSYPFLALASRILRHREVMIKWWESGDFSFSFEGFFARKIPNKQDLEGLVPSVWWPGSCEDIGSQASVTLAMTALAGAICKIEEMHRELCALVISFIPPASPSLCQGSVFRNFIQNLVLKYRGTDQGVAASGTFNTTVLFSVYMVILHFLSEGFPLEGPVGPTNSSATNATNVVGFLHLGGLRKFPVQLLLRSDTYYSKIPRIGGSLGQLFMTHQVDMREVQWEEGFGNDVETRVTHSTIQKPCCCSVSENVGGQSSKESLKLSAASSKGPCKTMHERAGHVPAECSERSLSDEIEEKPSSSEQSDADYGFQASNSMSIPMASQSSEALREEELLDVMLLLYHLGVTPNLRQAFHHMSQQSHSISLLEDTDKQIREKTCAEELKRLKEARSVYREELIDCTRHCIWYRLSLFSQWKQRGMYATCMWVADLILALSDSAELFLYAPEYYFESLVDGFHALRRSDPPFVSQTVFLKHGLASFVTLVVKHFNDTRILSADIKDSLLQSISMLVQYREFLIALESNREAVERMPRALLSAFDNRSWIPVTNILNRLCKGSGFASSKPVEPTSSALFQVLLRETCIHDQELFYSFLNQLFNTLSWTMTEFAMSIREMQDKNLIADMQHRKCNIIFEISCSLARILEFCTHEIPGAFFDGPDMNLRRLTELVVFVLNHIISAADAEFFDIAVRRSGQHPDKPNRTMILAPLVGIILNLMESCSTAGNKELDDVFAVFASMDCPATIQVGLHYLLSYNWCNVLRGDTSIKKLAQLKEFSGYFSNFAEARDKKGIDAFSSGEDNGDECCCICYNSNNDAVFEPCHHKSCYGCITRHLLNSHRCFFCNVTVTAVSRINL